MFLLPFSVQTDSIPSFGFRLRAIARGLMGSVTLLVSLILTPTTAAQTIVSNLTETNAGTFGVGPAQYIANAFTTGASATTLNSVTISLANYASGAGFAVKLYSDNSGTPGSLLESLSGPATPASTGDFSYTSGGTTLGASSTYWLVASATGNSFGWVITSSDGETSSEGWTIGNVLKSSSNAGTSWSPDGSSYASKFSVAATAIPEPSSYAALAGALTLGLTVWRRRRSR